MLATQTRLGTTASGWFDADKALAPDKQPAHSGGTTAALIVGGYGFTLPATATIRGISVEIRRSAQGTVVDSSLVLSGADQSESRASPLPWPTGNLTTYFDQTYGGPADLWGRAWTAAEVTSASFGARLRVTASGDGHVDAITITVHYCP
ncbi:MAG: hypothetical protein KC657_36360 [Myxococcales bacterium]|nr:hypothetical protein [Myxococcales bacterium]